jgi:hypothetical protein
LESVIRLYVGLIYYSSGLDSGENEIKGNSCWDYPHSQKATLKLIKQIVGNLPAFLLTRYNLRPIIENCFTSVSGAMAQ